MNTRILIAALVTSVISPIAFAQMSGGYGGNMNQSQPPRTSGGQSMQTQTTTTKAAAPVGVKGYLDNVMANSKDNKFHATLSGKNLALTPIKFHEEKKLGGGKATTAVDMRGVDGKIYEIDFVTSGDQVTSAKIGKVNGKAP